MLKQIICRGSGVDARLFLLVTCFIAVLFHGQYLRAECVPRDEKCKYGPGTCDVPDRDDLECWCSTCNPQKWRPHNYPHLTHTDVDNPDGTTTRTYKIYKSGACKSDGSGDRDHNDWENPQILTVTLCAVPSYKEVMRVNCPAPAGVTRIAGTLNGTSSLKIQKSDGTYGIELVDPYTSGTTPNPEASCVNIQMSTGRKAFRKCGGTEPNCT